MNWYLIGGLFLLSGLKLLMITPAAVIQGDLTSLTIAITCALGAWLSGCIFFLIGKQINRFFKPKPLRKNKIQQYRRIIKLKNRFKSFGTAMMMGILSVPISCLLVGKYFKNDKKAYLNIGYAAILWSFTLTYFTVFFKDLVLKLLKI